MLISSNKQSTHEGDVLKNNRKYLAEGWAL